MDLLDDATKVEKRLIAKATVANIPISASFELTPCCNLGCDMCFIRMTMDEIKACGGLKNLDFWLSLANELKKMGTLFILLTGGEPLLYPYFKELYKELKNMGFILTINTNGTCIDENIVQIFKERPPRRINVTLYGASSETYEKLCHRAGGFNQCMDGLMLLKKCGIDTKLNITVVNDNVDDFEKILVIGDKLGVPIEVNSYMFPCSRTIRSHTCAFDARLSAEKGGYIEALSLKHRKGKYFYETISALLSEIKMAKPSNNPVELSCRAGRSSVWINWQGIMTPCVMMEYPAANLNSLPTQKAWTEIVKMSSLLSSHEDCYGCTLRDFCQVCYASAYLEKLHYGTLNYICRFTKSELQTLYTLINEKK